MKDILSLMLKITLCLFVILASSPAYSQSFGSSGLSGESLNNPTSLQFGPDGRLYVSQQNGTIYAYTVVRNGANDYQVTNTETINNVKDIQNHNDDGSPNNGQTNREVTGLLVVGTANNPILYVTSSDFRIGGGGGGSDVNLDTNSGVISRLTQNGNGWSKVDLVRGLPRSEENHATNGLQLDESTNTLYVAQGGHTNAGAPSNNFAFTTEYALSAAILTVDLDAIDNLPTQNDNGSAYKYDLPTLDDPTRPNIGGQDVNDPFGGNDGLNQAKIVPGGPVQVYAPGFRNIFDVVLTESGNLYTWDNGANGGWGGHPANEGGGNATNNWIPGEPGSSGPGPNDPQVNNLDGLHFVTGSNYYGGHPNPIRANPSGAGLFTHDPANGSGGGAGVWRTNQTNNINTTLPSDWPPVPFNQANPIEGNFQNAGETDPSLFTVSASTNGMAEYTASNFNGGLQGNLLAASFNGNIYNISLNNSGSINNNSDVSVLASGFGSSPLDVTAQGDNDPFPGTVWAATYGSDNIVVFEPSDYGNTNPGTGGQDGIYINAGGPSVFTNGISWGADQYFSGGSTFSTTAAISGTTSDAIYQTERWGATLEYNIPVSPGTYDIQLHFAEIFTGAQNSGDRVFDVLVAGVPVLNDFDIIAEAGYLTATMETVQLIITGNELTISFNPEVENPKISAIAIIPVSSTACMGNPGNIDEDQDGFTNTDEIQNGTNPCNAADKPEDFDGTLIGGFLVSNLNDPDDDDDGIPDTSDKFAWDASNGQSTNLPIDYPFLNGDPGFGFFGLGFTGLMTNGTTDYLDLIQDEDNSNTEIIAGGAVGLFSLNDVSDGDATAGNNQENGYQFGVNVNSNTNSFAIESGILGPVFTSAPVGFQSAGIFLGNGDQNNYVKFVVSANNGNPGFEVLYENNGSIVAGAGGFFTLPAVQNEAEVKLKILVDPSSGTIQPQYAFGNNSFTNVGSSIQLTGSVLNSLQSSNQALAVGLISTANNTGSVFNATWDYLNIEFEQVSNTPSSLQAPSNVVVNNGTDFITVSHGGGDQPIAVQNISISNNNFAFNSFVGTPFTLDPGEDFQIEVSHTGGSNETAQITIVHNGTNANSIINLNSGSSPTTFFTPDPNKKYYIDSSPHNVRIGATGEAEDPYTTSTNTTGAEVEWKFVAKGNGSWHVQLDQGSKPRLRTRNNGEADMQATSSSGTWTYYDISEGYQPGTYFLTLPNGPSAFNRLQVEPNGDINFVSAASNGSWESFTIIEVPTSTGSGNGINLSFDTPNNNQVFQEGEGLGVVVNAADSNGSISNVQLFLNGTFVRQENIFPYTWGTATSATADQSIQNLAPGNYTLTAIATDNQGNTEETSIGITVEDNTPVGDGISVSFATPNNNQVFQEGEGLGVVVNAADSNGSISNVQLFLNGAFVRQENIIPYTWGTATSATADQSIQNLAPGSYTLTALATDNQGNNQETSISITVEDDAPTGANGISVSFATPSNNQVYQEGEGVGVVVDAADANGSISNVQLFLDGAFVRQESFFPYEWGTAASATSDQGLQNLAPGNYSLTAIATDNQGNQQETSITITIENDAPSGSSINLSFITPTNNEVFEEGESLGVDVNATDSDGSISNVQLFLNGAFVRQENFFPYEWGDANSGATDQLLLNLAPGNYTLLAVATDNQGNTEQSSIVITIEQSAGRLANPGGENTLDILAYPNPTSDLLNIDLTQLMDMSLEVRIVDMNGIEYDQFTLEADHPEKIELDVSDYKTGEYLILINNGSRFPISKKISIFN